MSDQGRTPPEDPGAEDGTGARDRAAFLPIGIVFLVLGLGGLANESFRLAGLPFIAIGATFLILGLQSGDGGGDAGADADGDGQDGQGPAGSRDAR